MRDEPTGHDAGAGDHAWVAVAHVPSRPVAEAIASALRGSGIAARITGDDAGGVLPHLDAMGRGVTVDVRADMVTAARTLLDSEPDGDWSDTHPDDRADITPGARATVPDELASDRPDDRPLAAPRPTRERWRLLFTILVIVAVVLAVATGLFDRGG